MDEHHSHVLVDGKWGMLQMIRAAAFFVVHLVLNVPNFYVVLGVRRKRITQESPELSGLQTEF